MDQNQPPSPLIVWWILWAAITMGLIFIFPFIPAATSFPADPGPLKFLPVLPLLAGSFIRWNPLPKATEAQRAMVLFVIGMALCEGCGILGIFVVTKYRETYFLLALVGLLQFAPFYARRFLTR